MILLEGILVLCDRQLRNMLDIKIYVDADADERILRRIVRDTKERGRDLEILSTSTWPPSSPCTTSMWSPPRSTPTSSPTAGMNDVAFDLVSSKIQAYLDSIQP